MIKIHDKKVTQKKDAWVVDAYNGQFEIKKVSITDGGLLHINGAPQKTDSYLIENCYNEKSTGKYFVMMWPGRPDKKQCAVPKFIWDNSGIKNPVIQGPNEAAFRGKIDDALIIKVRFRAFINKDGRPNKQIVQVRHGKKWVFQQCEFIDGWCDVGQQKTKQPDGSSKYETEQRVGSVVFDRCIFRKMPGAHSYVNREPGVGSIEYVNCIDPAGKKFSKKI